MTTKQGVCLQCKTTTVFILYRQVFMNGSDHFLWKCKVCDRKNPDNKALFISRETVEEYLDANQIDQLPVLMPELYTRCAVCGSRGAELHHWAPKALFDDYDKWPKDFLCKACHDRWHSVVTPQLKG